MSKNKDKKRRKELAEQAKRRSEFMQSLVIGTNFGILVIAALVVLFAKPEGIKLTDADLNFENQIFFGDPEAPVTLVEFVDFKCPHCKTFNETVVIPIKEKYIDTGKVRVVVVNYPFLGLDSRTAALAAETVFHMDPSAIYDFMKLVFAHQQDTSKVWATPELMTELALQVSSVIDRDEFVKALRERTYDDEVKRDLVIAGQLGIQGTPTVYVNGERIMAWSLPNIVQKIESELAVLDQGANEE